APLATLLIATSAAAAGHAAPLEPPLSVYLEELTWTEVRDEVHAGKTTVIVPVGGTEQSGPAIVLGKHNVRAHVLAGRIATVLGDALVAPVVAYVPEGGIDPPGGHMRFAGTISVPEAAFESTLEGAARSLRHAGFRDVVFLGDHGGYQKSLEKVATRLNREWAGTTARAHAVLDYYQAADRDYAQALRRKGYSEREIGSHAGLADTSLALAIDPRLVRSAHLHDGTPLGSAEGVVGDPRRANAQAGELGVELIVAATVRAVRARVAQR
ncbi:MAG: creatininase family protein, partial [Caldimonas sp.]